jgi:hypothetical protein
MSFGAINDTPTIVSLLLFNTLIKKTVPTYTFKQKEVGKSS